MFISKLKYMANFLSLCVFVSGWVLFLRGRAYYFFNFYLFNFCWNILDLQCCGAFRYTVKWFSYIYRESFQPRDWTQVSYIPCRQILLTSAPPGEPVYIHIYICIYIHTHVYTCIFFFYILFHYRLVQDVEYSLLCYAVGPCYWFYT